MVARALDDYDIDSASLFASAGIDLTAVNSTEARVSSISMQKVWALAVTATNDPCFGIHVAKTLQPVALYGLGLAWIASDTMKSGLQRLAQYFRVLVSVAM